MRTAIYPGSFDPVTNGHIDVLERAARLFDRVVITVARNPGKQPMFGVEERVAMVRESIRHIPNAEVQASDGLTVDFAARCGAVAIVKGLRVISDFENELKMAQMNSWLNAQVETVFIMTKAEYAFLSSSLVKEVASFGKSVEGLVPPAVARALRERYQGRRGV